jgi:hypothetical protein
MKRILLLVVVSSLVSGCTQGAAEPIEAWDEKAVVAPQPMVASPALDELVDPWAAGETERTLFEGTVVAELCGNAGEASASDPGVSEGCAAFELTDPIPAGTKAIRIDADATAALKSGSYYAYFYSAVNRFATEADGEPSSAPVSAWRWELDPREWDDAQEESSLARPGFWTGYGGTANVLNGPIEVDVIAEKDPEWVPTRPLPPMVLLDLRETWTQGAGAHQVAGTAPLPKRVRFAPIPEDAIEITLLLSWTVRDCPASYDCSPNPTVYYGNTAVPALEIERTETTVVRRVIVPESVQPDPSDAALSATSFSSFVWRCHEDPNMPLPCLASFYAYGVSVDVHAVVLAWFTPFDADVARETAFIGE